MNPVSPQDTIAPAAYAGAAAAPSPSGELPAPAISRTYQCQCGRRVFLGNSQCLACGTPLGYVTQRLGVVPLAPAPGLPEADAPQAAMPPPGAALPASEAPPAWTVFGDAAGPRYHRCVNFFTAAGCNWMVPAHAPSGDLAPGYCLACSATRTIPDLSQPGHPELWRKLEAAKRRVLSQLLALGLPVPTRHADPVHGVAFDFLSNLPGQPEVLTGHDEGVITLNVAEADDAERERIRAAMHEPYRALVGHFRHEIGHYYWDLLVRPGAWLEDFRRLFGDERADYTAALRTHYEQGPPPDWRQRYVTGYASTHPWEDWAETWAHYLHMADSADTALSFGIDAADVEVVSDPFMPADLWQPQRPQAAAFLEFLNGWVRLTNVFNELARSMGQPDLYPFVLPRAAVGKLQFVHEVIASQRQASAAASAGAPSAPPAMPLAEAQAPPS